MPPSLRQTQVNPDCDHGNFEWNFHSLPPGRVDKSWKLEWVKSLNKVWQRVEKAYEISLDAELLAGIPLQKRPMSTKKVFAPGRICPEWGKPDTDVNAIIKE